MPFIPNTPESRIARSDSKNAATTCRGITSGGRPCRRPLAAAAASTTASPFAAHSRVHRLRVDDPSDPDLYCWQHKDQASSSANSTPGPTSRTKLNPIRQDSRESIRSLESLVGRLGIVEAERPSQKPSRNSNTPPNSKPNEKNSGTGSANVTQAPKVQKHVSFCCCFTVPVYETDRPLTPNPRPVQNTPAKPSSAKLPPNRQHLAPPATSQRPSLAASKKSSAQSTVSQTSQYLSLIPNSVLPETAATLLKELSKPFAPTDEPGYIYIFWLTPESQPSGPPAKAARDLLAPPSRPDVHQRRTSDVLQSFATRSNQTGSSSRTILLKIGRASNVQRRMNEWQRQCGYDISLIRYYPYVSSSQQSTPRKMPHSHKVERLIHIELEGQGLRVHSKANCHACGKNHKEWFEVEATRAGINAVDETVRRWSDWDEGNL
ncbi:meiotically up-regulated gene 113-domain-containing protein [Xylaria intraflava]|nr:meiotically up-regulated gene 113-domain-containing protein [Xylaria intraflava]